MENEQKALTPQEFISLYQSNPKPMPMTNEEKANEICKRHIFDSNHFDCCMEIAQWKDEQHKQEKQQWIDKAVMYISTHTLTTMSITDIHNMIVDFKQAMKGE